MSFKALVLISMLALSRVLANAPADPHAKKDEHAEEHDDHEGMPKPSADAFVVSIRDLPKDFLLPGGLWDLLLKDPSAAAAPAPAAGGHGAPGAEADENELPTAAVLFASVSVELREDNRGVLRYPVIRFDLPKGGGAIDLSQWTTGERGTFTVSFFFDEKMGQPNRMFHLSRSRKRKIDGKIYGGGCKFFYDIASVLKKYPKGLPVNTTNNFHISTLGGHFVFGWKMSDGDTVTNVRIFDSKQPQLACPAHAQAEAPEAGA